MKLKIVKSTKANTILKILNKVKIIIKVWKLLMNNLQNIIYYKNPKFSKI